MIMRLQKGKWMMFFLRLQGKSWREVKKNDDAWIISKKKCEAVF